LTDTTPIEEMHRQLVREIGDLQTRIGFMEHSASITAAENATLREVNAARAEQLRRAQERIRAAEAERDKTVFAYALQERRAIEAEAERDRAWNEAIEAACGQLAEMHAGYMRAKGRDPAKYSSHLSIAATAIRSLIKGAGE
jgi:uncharacterized membrane protein YqiK